MSSSESTSEVPRHIAVIMDGNGRWARRRKWNRVRGHREGIESVRCLVRSARRTGIRYLTLFAFSSENWGRPTREIRALMSMLGRFLKREVPDLKAQGVRVRAVGDLERLPRVATEALAWAEAETREETGLDLILALSYGGRGEILRAVRRMVEDVVDPHTVDEEGFRRYLDAPDLPDPDLLIRTSGEMRISNFLLWQLAYSEIYVTDLLWPDFREEAFAEALAVYARRDRRFGLIAEQQAAAEKGGA